MLFVIVVDRCWIVLWCVSCVFLFGLMIMLVLMSMVGIGVVCSMMRLLKWWMLSCGLISG